MSPEIVNEESHDFGVDIWCLGVLLYEMLHGNPPFHAENLSEIKEEFQNKKIEVDERFDPDTRELISLMLEYDPNKRISISQALNHRALRKNYKHICRKLTQEEYKILTKYYYMNSGGNQLVTHNSTYARQLKRQSMLSKLSTSSYKSTDSSFYNQNPSPLKLPVIGNTQNQLNFGPSPYKNEFMPNKMIDQTSLPQMSQELAESVFKKKGMDTNDEPCPDIGPEIVDQQESMKKIDFVKKKSLGNTNVNTVSVGIEVKASPKNERKVSQKLPNDFKTSKDRNKEGQNKPREVSNDKRRTPQRPAGFRGRVNGHFKTKSKSPTKDTAVIISARRNQSFDLSWMAQKGFNPNGLHTRKLKGLPIQHTTLKEFQKKYAMSRFQEKYKNSSVVKTIFDKGTKGEPPKAKLADKGQSREITNQESLKGQASNQRSVSPQLKKYEISVKTQPSQNRSNYVHTTGPQKNTALVTKSLNIMKSNSEPSKPIVSSMMNRPQLTEPTRLARVDHIVRNNSSKGYQDLLNQSNMEKVTQIDHHRNSEQPKNETVKKYKSDSFTNFNKAKKIISVNKPAYPSQSTPKINTMAEYGLNNHKSTPQVSPKKQHIPNSDPVSTVKTQEKMQTTNGYPTRIISTGNENHENSSKGDAKSYVVFSDVSELSKHKNKIFVNYDFDSLKNFPKVPLSEQNTPERNFDEEQQERRKTWDRRTQEPVERESKERLSEKRDTRNLTRSNLVEKKNLSKIFEESVSKEISLKNTLDLKRKESLMELIKKTKQNVPHEKEIANFNFLKNKNRSKSTNLANTRANNVTSNGFVKRVVFVNGVKTEKMIYSKSNLGSIRGSKSKVVEHEVKSESKPQKSSEIIPRIKNVVSVERKIQAKNNPENASYLKPINTTSLVNVSNLKNSNQNKEKENEKSKKSKYKVITVPQQNARVNVKGGQKLSNVKPITIIQQGSFALSSSRTKEKIGSMNSKLMDKEKQPSNIPPTLKKESEKEIKPIHINSTMLSPGMKRVISLKEYKRHVNERLARNQKNNLDLDSKKMEFNNLIVENTSSQNPLLTQYNNISKENSISAQGKEVYHFRSSQDKTLKEGPIIRKLTRTMSKPLLNQTEKLVQVLNKSNNRYEQKHSETHNDNYNSLVKKISQLNNTEIEIDPQSKTVGSRSLGGVLRQINKELNISTKSREHPVSYTQTPTNNPDRHKLYGHRKNNTIYSISKTRPQVSRSQKIMVASKQNGNSIKKQPSQKLNPLNVKQIIKIQNQMSKPFQSSLNSISKNLIRGPSFTQYKRLHPPSRSFTSSEKINPNLSKANYSMGQYSHLDQRKNSFKPTTNDEWKRLSYGRRIPQVKMPKNLPMKQSHSVKLMNKDPIRNNYSYFQNSLQETNSRNLSTDINRINQNISKDRNAKINFSNDRAGVKRYIAAPNKYSTQYRLDVGSYNSELNGSRTKSHSNNIQKEKRKIFNSFNQLKKKEVKMNYFDKPFKKPTIKESAYE